MVDHAAHFDHVAVAQTRDGAVIGHVQPGADRRTALQRLDQVERHPGIAFAVMRIGRRGHRLGIVMRMLHVARTALALIGEIDIERLCGVG